MMTSFGQLPTPLHMSLACATLLWPVCQSTRVQALVDRLVQRWRLTNKEHKTIQWLLEHESTIHAARQLPWPRVQRVLIHPLAHDLMALARATAMAKHGPEADLSDWQFCRDRLSLPTAQLDPTPLITGNDLKHIGVPFGPVIGELLEAVRDAQLEGKISTATEALAWAKSQVGQGAP